MQFDARVLESGEGTQHVEIGGEDDMAILKPEIEQIAQADVPIKLVWREAVQEFDELPMACGVLGRGLQVYVREDQGLLHRKPNLLSGQMRKTARPMTL